MSPGSNNNWQLLAKLSDMQARAKVYKQSREFFAARVQQKSVANVLAFAIDNV